MPWDIRQDWPDLTGHFALEVEMAKAKKEERTLTAGEIAARGMAESVDQWRSAQGLPPIDRSKEARTKDNPKD